MLKINTIDNLLKTANQASPMMYKYQVEQAKELMTYVSKRYHVQNYHDFMKIISTNDEITTLVVDYQFANLNQSEWQGKHLDDLYDFVRQHHFQNWRFTNNGRNLADTTDWLGGFFTKYVRAYHQYHDVQRAVASVDEAEKVAD